MFVFIFSSRSSAINVHGNTRYSKNDIPDQTDGIYTLSDYNDKSIPYFRLEMLENDTLWGGTYLYGLRMGVPPPPPPPGISDLTLNIYPVSDTVICCHFVNSRWDLRRTGLRDASNDVRVFFSSRCNVRGNTLLLKMVSQTEQTEYTPYFRPKRQNLYPI